MVITWMKDALISLIVVNASQIYVYQLIALFILPLHKCYISII